MPEENELASEGLGSVGDLARLKSLRIRLERLQKGLNQYMKALVAEMEGRHFDANGVLATAQGLSQRLAADLSTAAADVESTQLEEQVEKALRSARLYYREELERELDLAGVARAGQWPTYVLGNLLHLSLDLDGGVATLDRKKVPTLEPGKIAELVRAGLAKLLERSFSSGEFLSLLRSAYDHVTRQAGRALGDYAAIQDVLQCLGSTLKESGGDLQYSEAKLAADLWKLMQERRVMTEDGRILDLSPAQDAARGIFVPDQSGGNYMAALRFVTGGRDV